MDCIDQNVAHQESEMRLFLFVKNVWIFLHFMMFSCVCTNLILIIFTTQ